MILDPNWQGCHIWAKSGSDWLRMRQIRDYSDPDVTIFGQPDPQILTTLQFWVQFSHPCLQCIPTKLYYSYSPPRPKYIISPESISKTLGLTMFVCLFVCMCVYSEETPKLLNQKSIWHRCFMFLKVTWCTWIFYRRLN